MAEDRIDSYVDRTGFASDTKFVLEQLNTILEVFNKLDNVKIGLFKSTGLGETIPLIKEANTQITKMVDAQQKLATVTTRTAEATRVEVEGQRSLSEALAKNKLETDKLSAAKKKLADDFKNDRISQDQYLKGLADIIEKQKALGASTQQYNLALKNIANVQDSETGSLRALRGELNLALQAFDNLAAAEKETASGQALKKKIDELTEAITKEEQATGRFQRNVGNYANSLAGGFSKVTDEIEKLRQKKTQLETEATRNPVGFKIGNGPDQIKQITSALDELNRVQAIGFQTNGNLKTQVKQLETAYQNMASSGTQSNEFLKEFRKFTADAKDQLEDLRGEIKALSSDTLVFDQVAQGVKFLAASGQVALSVMELVGSENEDVQRSIQRLIIIQNVANGVQELANQLTLRGSIINKAYVFIQGLIATAFDRSAAAAVRFNAALGLLGIAATVVGAIVIAMTAFRKESDKTAESVDALTKEQEKNKEVAEAGRNEVVKVTTSILDMKSKIELAKQGFINKDKVLKEYNDTLGKSFGKVNDLGAAEQAIIDNTAAFVQAAVLRAEATKLIEQAAEKAGEAFQIPETVVPTFAAGSQNPETAAEQKKRREQENQIARDRIKNDQKNLEERATALLAKANQILKDKGIRFGDELTSTDTKGGKTALEKELDLLKEIAQTEGLSFSKRLGALQMYYDKKKDFITNSISDSEEEALRLQQLSNEFGGIFDKIFKWEDKDQLISDVQEIADVTSAELITLSEDSDETIKNLGEKVLSQVKALTDAEKKLIQETEDNYINAFQSIAEATESIIGGLFDTQKNKIQEQIDDIERLKNAEIDRINATGDSEEKKAAKIKIVEAKAQANKELLERRQRQIDRQRAVTEKGFKAFQIITDNIQAVNKIRTLIFSAPDPFTKALYVSQLVAQIASGAASLASIIATPLPQFAKGKKANDPYTGPAIVAEKGREIGVDSKGNLTMYDKPTVTWIGKGTAILPNKVTEDIIKNQTVTQAAQFRNITISQPDNRELIETNTKMLKEMGELTKLTKKMLDRSRIFIQNNTPIESTAWYEQHMKR